MRFSEKSVVYIGSNVAGSLLQIVMGMVMVRFLLKYDYGTFRQIMLLSVLVPSSLALGLPQSLSYFIPREASPRRRKQLALQVFTLLVILGAVASAAIYHLRDDIGRGFSNPSLGAFAPVFSLYFLFLVPSQCAKATLLSLGRIGLASVLHLATALGNFSFVVVPLLLGRGLEDVLLGLLVVYAAKFAVVVWVLLGLDGGFPKLLDWPTLREQLQYSAPLWLAYAVGTLRLYVDKFVVAFLYPPESFAVYSRGAFELPVVAMVPFALGSLLTPRFAEMYKKGEVPSILRLWREAIRRVALLFFPLFVFCFVFAEPIITILFTPEYRGSVPIFRIYLCLLPLRLAAYRTILTAVGKTTPVLGATMAGLATSAVVGLLLVERFGIRGPAWGIVIGEVLAIAWMLRSTRRALGASWLDLVPVGKLVPSLVGSCLVGAAASPLSSRLAFDVGVLVACTIGYFGLYVAFMRAARFLPDEDWALARRFLTLKVFKELK